MIELAVSDLGWIKGAEDDPEDQCAHGLVEFTVNGTQFVSPRDEELTVSAAGLFLLRTLEDSHTPEQPVAGGNLLFPHCGFNVWPDDDGRYGVMCLGCPYGVDVEVVHEGDLVAFRASGGRADDARRDDWTRAVVGFADQVRRFYDASLPKRPPKSDHDRRGWELFWREWDDRRRRVEGGAAAPPRG